MSPPITTKPATSYVARAALMAVICIVFGLWGAYDLWIKIPHREQQVREFEHASATLKRLDDARQSGITPTPQDLQEYAAAQEQLRQLMPGGQAPVAPSEWDKPTQWLFIACLPFAIWPIMQLNRVRKQRYTLDEAGALHFAGDARLGSGVWRVDEVRDIDMSRWMRKSIAEVVHGDGKRLTLDAYVHKSLELIVGSLASRLHPDQWTSDAKPVKFAASTIDAASNAAAQMPSPSAVGDRGQ
jgi:hypothetical protein